MRGEKTSMNSLDYINFLNHYQNQPSQEAEESNKHEKEATTTGHFYQDDNESSSGSESNNSSNSSDEENDALFQPTSIFEYEVEQPGGDLSKINDQDINFGSTYEPMELPQSINSIVNEIKNNKALQQSKRAAEKNNQYTINNEQEEYNNFGIFLTSDTDEEEKVDKNDTEWCTSSLKQTKRKNSVSGSYSTSSNNTASKLASVRKVSRPVLLKVEATKAQEVPNGQQPVQLKKKRGRKPKYLLESQPKPQAIDKPASCMSTFRPEASQGLFNMKLQQAVGNQDFSMKRVAEPRQFNNPFLENNNKPKPTSGNSSMRSSDISNLSSTSSSSSGNSSGGGGFSGDSEEEEEEYDNTQSEDDTKAVLIEDNGLLNQSSKSGTKKNFQKLSTIGAKKGLQNKTKLFKKKRNSKSLSAILESSSGGGVLPAEFASLDAAHQLNEVDYFATQSNDENNNSLLMKEQTGGANGAGGESNMIKQVSSTAETYLIDRYKYAVRHIRQGLSVEEACNKYRISKGALLKCLSGGTAPRGKKTRLTESEENEIVEWLINNKDLKYNEAIHLVFEQVEQIFEQAQRPNPFNNGKPSMDWWYDFLSRHPQIMASKSDWLMRGKVNDQYIKDVQSGQLKCTKFRRALLSAIQYIRSLNDAPPTQLQSATGVHSLSKTFKAPVSNPSTLQTNKPKQTHGKINKSLRICKPKRVGTEVQIAEASTKTLTAISNEIIMEEQERAGPRLDDQVPSPTSLDTRIFNSEHNCATNSFGSIDELSYTLLNNKGGASGGGGAGVKSEKSIQDSLEYLYEQNNNFINEISHINQLMVKSSNKSSFYDNMESKKSEGDEKEANFRTESINGFDNFLEEALNDQMNNKSGDLLLPTNNNCHMADVCNSGPLGDAGVEAQSIEDLGASQSYLASSFSNGTNDENFFHTSYHQQDSYFNSSAPTSMYRNFDMNKKTKPVFNNGDMQFYGENRHHHHHHHPSQHHQHHMNKNVNENNILMSTGNNYGFNNYSQSQPFVNKLDFSPKNHLLIPDDDDENDEDEEDREQPLVSSLMNSTDVEHIEDDNEEASAADRLSMVNSIGSLGFMP